VDSSNTVIVSVMVEEKGRQTADKKEGRKPWTLREFGGQTVWDWLHLLSALAIPVVLAAAGLWFTAQQEQRQQEIEGQRAKQAQKIENKRAQAERELAEQRAQDEALQAYLNQMSQLMLDRKLLEAEQGTPVHTLAQARTSTVILRLDAEHNESVTRFLIDSGLAVRREASARLLSETTLSQATLRDAYLPNVDLGNADLGNADLSGAILHSADLSGAILDNADLISADLSEADLSGANLYSADLSNAFLGGADLRGAELSRADLSNAFLGGVNLRGAYLIDADLSGAKLGANEQLRAASSLEGATMPDGRTLRGDKMPNGPTFEDWLKDKEARKKVGKDE
jgi:uncharacterized protein YjbI with pentapeptide repeats